MMKSLVTVLLFCALATMGYAQSTLKGRITDSKTNEPLIGATVMIKGTSIGITTGLDGDFILKTDETGDKKVVVNSLGYSEKEVEVQLKGDVVDLGNITLESNSVGLNEVRVIASMAVDRKTPVAVSSISQAFIEDKLGNNEFPEILSQTPGIYATKQGGAYGDSRINVRGFDSRNVAVMINGIPINDMENGAVFWSDWAGLADVTRSMQVQRGLGASKVAVPSVGGTINIVTNTTEAQRGGNIFTTIGNDNMIKYGATFSSGLTKNNWATTIQLSKNTGNGYVDATQYEGYSYFFNLSKKINNKHTLSFTAFGAPQWHNQRSFQITFSQYEKYNGIRYNDNWGYKDGQIFNVKKNYFHKPQASLNHYWTINENTSVSTSLYGSIGTGGGTGLSSSPISANYRTNDGLINFTKLMNDNIALGTQGSGNIVKSSRNDHTWFGAISTLTHKLSNLTFTAGLDARTYVGKHYQTVSDLLGGQFFIDKNTASNGDVNLPNKVAGLGDEVGYHDDGHVNWYGAFGQAEYTMDKLTVFAAGSISDKWYQRVDYMRYFSDDLKAKLNNDPTLRSQYINAFAGGTSASQIANGTAIFNTAMKGQKSNVADMIGYGVKGGANFNISKTQNVYLNTGYFERQPDFNTVYPNNLNYKNKGVKNEKIFSFELGYGFRTEFLTANLNLYHTAYNDKTEFISGNTADGTTFFANASGVDALHRGIELDFVTAPVKRLKINGVVSIGDWKWTNNVDSIQVFDENQTPIGKPTNLYLKNVHVGNVAQTVLGIGVDYGFMESFTVGANFNYYDRLYANYDPTKRTSSTLGDVWQLPSYGLLDMNLRYNFTISGMNSSLIANVHNLLNTKYFSEGTDGTMSDPQVWYGLGTTWSVGLKIRF